MTTSTPTTAIAEYEPIAAALAGIEKYRGLVFDVTTTQGMKEAKAAQREVAAPRIALEKTRTKLKADVLERGRKIDGEAKRIGALFAAIEDPLVDQIQAQERREEEARQAAIRAEQERLEAAERARKEAEERVLAAQRAEIARQRSEIDRQRKEQEALAAEARRQIEEEERASRQRIAEAEAKARAERQAEEDRLRAERKKLDDEQRARDAELRRQQEEAAERQREALRQQNELADARTMLETFKKRFGHRPEFVLVLEAIDDCLQEAA